MKQYDVIIADDERFVRETLKNYLNHHCPELNIFADAANGKDILEQMSKHNVDIVISDIKMPDMDGLEFMHFLREKELHTVGILITGYHTYDFIKKAIDANVFGFIEKPVDYEKLVKLIREAELKIDEYIDAVQIRANNTVITHQQQRYKLVLHLFGINTITCNELFCFFDGISLEKCPCFIVEFRFSGKFPLGSHIDDCASICEFINDKIDTYCISVMPTRIMLLVFTSEYCMDKAGAYVLKYAQDMCNIISFMGGTECHFLIDTYPSFNDVSEQKIIDPLKITDQSHVDNMTDELIKKIELFIESAKTEDYSLNSVAEHFAYNASYLSRLFKQRTGKTFTNFLNDMRMRKARELLRFTRMDIPLIAKQLGYTDKSHFYKAFKQYIGITPGKYRTTVGGE